MRFTVLGAGGFIGGMLASRLAKNGHEVSCPARLDMSSLDRWELGHVFYCLGEDDVAASPYNALDAHVLQLANILKSQNFASLAYLSSTRVYLGARSACEESQLEISPHDERVFFNLVKLAGEQLCFACKEPAVRAIRLSTVIGFAPRGTSLIPTLIKDASQHGRMRLTNSQQSSRDYIAVEDVLEILPRVAMEGRQRCYNLASGVNVPLGEVVRVISDQFTSECDWQSNAPTVDYPVIDISRIRTEFSFSPRPALEALVSACAEFRRHLKSPLDFDVR